MIKENLQKELEKLHIEELQQFFYKQYGKPNVKKVREECTSVMMRGLRHFWEWEAAPAEDCTSKQVQYLQTLADTSKFIEEDLKPHPVVAGQMRSHFKRKRELVADYQEKISEKINPSTEDAVQESPPSES